MLTQRYTGLDILRACAIGCVVAGHFFMNSEFRQAEFCGASMFVQGTAKFFFGMGVPLFLMMTGFVNTVTEQIPS